MSEPTAIINRIPIYELWIKRAAHLEPEAHIFDSGKRVYSPHDVLDFYGERLRVVDRHRQTLLDTPDGTEAVERLTCIPA
jgi:hypothetical protein